MLTTSAARVITCNSLSFVSKRTFFTSKFNTKKEKIDGEKKYDLVGPPHPVANIRPFRFNIPKNESNLHKKLRLLREDTQEFNKEFWIKHNTDFNAGREAFISKILAERYPNESNKKTISAEDMSEFYKMFLDQQWKTHMTYNREWQKRNFNILALLFGVKIEGLFSRLK